MTGEELCNLISRQWMGGLEVELFQGPPFHRSGVNRVQRLWRADPGREGQEQSRLQNGHWVCSIECTVGVTPCPDRMPDADAISATGLPHHEPPGPHQSGRIVDISENLIERRCRDIAAECPMRWQHVRRVILSEEANGFGRYSRDWMLFRGEVDEVADFVWSCWLDEHGEDAT